MRMGSAKRLRQIDLAVHEYIRVSRRTLLFGGIAAIVSKQFLGAELNLIDSLSAATVVTRKGAHSLSADDPEVKLLRDAVKALTKRGDDPTGWKRMSTYHRDFCGTRDSNEVHFTWVFLPWHRFYLTIVERHLQAAVNEPNLALLYWDWYATRKIPGIFVGSNNPLLDPTRNPSGLQMEDDNFGNALSEGDLSALPQFAGFGGSIGAAGALENGPHGGGHIYSRGNMANFATAAIDPLFYAHHGNVDRLWEVWRNAANRNDPPDDSEWNGREFAFLDVDGTMRKWRSKDGVKTQDLGYKYDTIAPKAPLVTANANLAAPASAPIEIKIPLATSSGQEQDYSLGGSGLAVKPKVGPASDTLAAPLSSTSTSELLAGRKLFLLVQGIKVPPEAAYVHVHINFGGNVAQLTRTLSRETQSYAGSAVLVPGGGAAGEPTIDLKIALTGRARSITTPLASLQLSIIPFDAAGERLAETTSVQGLQLSLE